MGASGGVVDSQKIRNVLLIGHGGTGKSTLAEAMLQVATGTTARGEGCPTVDHEPEERDAGHSLGLAAIHFTFDGCKMNVLDAPGAAEAIGDAYPAIRATDTAIFVVDASVGVQAQHEDLWAECERLGVPRVVFLNKLDRQKALYQENIDALRERYGKPLAPVHMPVGVEDDFTGVIDLLHFNAVEFIDGRRVVEEVPQARREQAGRNREFLVEAIVENDDAVLERYLEGEAPQTHELDKLFARGIANNTFFPVLCGSAKEGIGVELLLHFIAAECPSPIDAPHALPDDGPTTLYVTKTFSDQYVGRINLLRVLRGSLSVDDHVINTRTGADLRLHQLFTLVGIDQTPAAGAAYGDIVGVAKLDDVETGDLLTADGKPVEVDTAVAPEGYHRVVLQPVTTSDDDKLSVALRRAVNEDPSIRLSRAAGVAAQIASFYGPQHVDATIRRMERKYGVRVVAEEAPVAFRETIQGTATGEGRHVKQSGGHGQYGIAHIEVSPLPRGAGFEFDNAIVGGVIPTSLIPSVEKGVLAAMEEGPLGGYPLVDLKVRLFDGKYHSVDSSDAAFQMAGILALRDALKKVKTVLLEPIMDVEVTVPDDLTGTIMGDLSSRRGRILGTEVGGTGQTLLRAQVPEVELRTYQAQFRSLSHGAGQLSMSFAQYEEMPEQAAKRALSADDPD